MLNNLLEMGRLPQATFVFILGLLVVFVGMIVIVLVVSIIGHIMEKKKQPKPQESTDIEVVAEISNQEKDIPAHIKAVIVATISAYYFNQQSSECEFKIKKIKRI